MKRRGRETSFFFTWPYERFHLDTIHSFFYSLYSSKPLYLHCSIVSALPKKGTLGLCLCTLKYIKKVFKYTKLL